MEPTIWLVVLAAGALLVRVGQMFGAVGTARAKNAASAGARSLADFFFATLGFWALGSAIAFQTSNSVFAVRTELLVGLDGLSANWLALLTMTLISTGIVAPVVAERSRFIVPIALGIVLAAIVVPISSHWSWRGWLAARGLIDVAGAGPIHLAGAVVAVVGAVVIGPREGKYNRDGSANMIPGHNASFQIFSITLMIVGWICYAVASAMRSESGRSVQTTAADVLVAAAAAGAVSIVVSRLRFGKIDLLQACSGALGGLVAISAGAGTLSTPAACAVGALAGIVVPWLIVHLDLKFRIDDPAGLVAAHGGGAVVGLMFTALFASGNETGRLQAVGVAALAIVSIGVFAGAAALLVMLALKLTTGVRVSEQDEFDGLDLAEHDINAYPDFQQTMIKSYHLREA